MMALGTFTN